MLGSVHDADDALQEALVRAWRALPRFEGRSSAHSWLYRIATNTCLDVLARRPARVLPMDRSPALSEGGSSPGARLPATTWVEPYPDDASLGEGPAAPHARYEQREAVELAFIAALQHLPPLQRAVLILRDVLGFRAREVAEMLDTSVPAVNSALQRARKTVDERLPDRSQQATMRELGDEGVRALVKRFIDAFERGDVDAIVDLLTDDATFAMPPYSTWYRGRDAVAGSWLLPSGPPPRLRYAETRANGQVALGVYAREGESDRYVPLALDVLGFGAGRIAAVTAFRTPEVFSRFGLPEALTGPGPASAH